MSPDLPDFRDLAVAVAGDVICDRYQSCEPKSLSREAPVLVLRHIAEEIRAGGAGNVARNLRALGAKTALFGVVGRDAPGRELREALQTEQIDVDGLITAPDWITPQKTRIVAAEARRNQQQVLRIDSEPLGAAPVELRRLALSKLRERVLEFDALVLSEYDYGFVDSELAALAEEFSRRGRIVVLDPRESFEGFHGLSALTPNLGELANFAKLPSERLADPRVLELAAAQVLERSRARWLLVTRGKDGMALFGEGLPRGGLCVQASGNGNVTDVTGAGDTAAAVFALALARKLDPASAMRLANAAAGVVVMESGAAVCAPEALAAALADAPRPTELAGSARP
jgi:D-beta-D-heptose 7-phosphate kinase/D-beta-D-heptose 1-phosphate adenosyltransferase